MEHAYTFGHSAQLVGILTDSKPVTGTNETPIVLLLNSGLQHRVGPFRLHVDLARELAAKGFAVFRFDLSGIGDSEKHRDSRSREEQILADIGEAMDFLASRTATQRFVVMGLCTGADNAHKISVMDERIIGAVFMDGYIYPTSNFYLKRFGAKLFNPFVYLRSIQSKLARLFAKAATDSTLQDKREENYFWTLPPKQKTILELKSLIARGTKLLYIYSGGFDLINYKNQLGDCFKSIDFKDQLQVEYFDESEHTYPIISDRQRLIDTIGKWLQENFS